MTDRKISGLDTIAGSSVDVDADFIEIVDSSETQAKRRNKKITPAELVAQTSVFTQSGSGASAETVQDVLRRIIFRASYDSDASFNTTFAAGRSNATIGFATTGGGQVQVTDTTDAVNYLKLTGAATGGSVKVLAAGSDTDIYLGLASQGAGGISFGTGSVANEQFRVKHVANVVNHVEIGGGATGAGCQIAAEGDDSTVDLLVFSRGDASEIRLNDALYVKRIDAGTENYFQVDGGASGVGRITLSAQGEESAIQIDIEGKGTGGVRIKGSSSILYVNESANGGMTCGLTVNQGEADNEILALKSSDVAHGVTTIMETDTFSRMLKTSATEGGLRFDVIRATNAGAFRIRGIGGADNTTKSTSGVGMIDLEAAKINSTGIQDCGADANLLTIRNNATTRFIFDAEGSAHADVEWTTFDKYDDVAVLDALDMEMRRRGGDPVKAEFGEWVFEAREILQREGIFNFYDDGPRAMMNLTRMHMLQVGAIRQLAREVRDLQMARLENGG